MDQLVEQTEAQEVDPQAVHRSDIVGCSLVDHRIAADDLAQFGQPDLDQPEASVTDFQGQKERSYEFNKSSGVGATR